MRTPIEQRMLENRIVELENLIAAGDHSYTDQFELEMLYHAQYGDEVTLEFHGQLNNC